MDGYLSLDKEITQKHSEKYYKFLINMLIYLKILNLKLNLDMKLHYLSEEI